MVIPQDAEPPLSAGLAGTRIGAFITRRQNAMTATLRQITDAVTREEVTSIVKALNDRQKETLRRLLIALAEPSEAPHASQAESA